MKARTTAVLLTASTLLIAPLTSAITRDEIMSRAHSFAFHPWRSAAANQTASCSSKYESKFQPGDYMGLPYDWGGYMGLFEFDQGLTKGLGAGSFPADGVLSCTVGLDCSGFVSQSWGSTHLTTSTLHLQSSAITQAKLLPGDAINKSGYHVVLYANKLASGAPLLIESVGYNVHVSSTGGWSYLDGYTPRRYNKVTGTTASDVKGSLATPIVIPSLPFSASGSTKTSKSSMIDGCGASASKPTAGPEVVYQVKITQPGKLTVSVADDAATDVDVHLFRSSSTNDCVARHDSTFTQQVDCGTYLIVVDTYGTSAAKAGSYQLTVSHRPGGTACGTSKKGYDFYGELGDACAFPANEDLPFCNENLGATTCLYTPKNESFCTKECAKDSDCSVFAGGCCKAVASGEKYCMTKALCASGFSLSGAGTGVEISQTQSPYGWGDPSPESDLDVPSKQDALQGTVDSEQIDDSFEQGCVASGKASNSSWGPLIGLVLAGLANLARRRRTV